VINGVGTAGIPGPTSRSTNGVTRPDCHSALGCTPTPEVAALAPVDPLLPALREVPEHRVVAGPGQIGDDVFRRYFVLHTPPMPERYERYLARPRAALPGPDRGRGRAAGLHARIRRRNRPRRPLPACLARRARPRRTRPTASNASARRRRAGLASMPKMKSTFPAPAAGAGGQRSSSARPPCFAGTGS
jgi:hypothetical protein